MKTRQGLVLPTLLAICSLAAACKPGGGDLADKPSKTCSGTVVTAATPTQGSECTSCGTEFPAGKVITRDCTGPAQDKCPLASPFTSVCENLNAPVSPKNQCTMSLKDITACK